MQGGPADGVKVGWRDPLIWIDADGKSFEDPGEGRGLYRRSGSGYEFVGFQMGRCEGCGAFVDRPAETCSLCGAKVVRA